MVPRAYTFITTEKQIDKKDTFVPHSPLNENPKNKLNGILPPFKAEGRDGVPWNEMLW